MCKNYDSWCNGSCDGQCDNCEEPCEEYVKEKEIEREWSEGSYSKFLEDNFYNIMNEMSKGGK